MQVLEDLVLSKDHTQIIRGKRTKRQRLPSPLRLAMSLPSYNADTNHYNQNENETSSRELVSATTTTEDEEDHDMANCLILLAQGHNQHHHHHHHHDHNNIYQCKTCDRRFSSSQALGGHRASHSKLHNKATDQEKRGSTQILRASTPTSFMKAEEDYDFHDRVATTNTILSLQIPNRAFTFSATSTTKKSKVHECSICGAEFSSGQALGGHMRRHRTLVSTNSTTTTTSGSGNMMNMSSISQEANKKPRIFLKLDLNLPAVDPEDDQSKFSFQARESGIDFSRSSLVDCHY